MFQLQCGLSKLVFSYCMDVNVGMKGVPLIQTLPQSSGCFPMFSFLSPHSQTSAQSYKASASVNYNSIVVLKLLLNCLYFDSRLENYYRSGGRHIYVVSSAPTILRPRVQISSTPSTLFSIIEIVSRK